MTYILLDCLMQHKENPETFEVPTSDEVAEIKTGDYVKLIFIEEGSRPERMWVEVTYANFPYFTGELNNDPYQMESVKLGDVVNFEAQNIASILTEN